MEYGIKNLVSHWNHRAENYDATPGNSLTVGQLAEWRGLLSAIYPRLSGRLLDVGCGTGSYSMLLAEIGFVVHGIDMSEGMIERARKKEIARRRPGERANPRFSVLAAADISGKYDAVFSRNIFWTVENPEELIETVSGSATEEAVWVAVETIWDGYPKGDYQELGAVLPGFAGWHPNVLKKMFTNAGFARSKWFSISNREELATADQDLHILFQARR